MYKALSRLRAHHTMFARKQCLGSAITGPGRLIRLCCRVAVRQRRHETDHLVCFLRYPLLNATCCRVLQWAEHEHTQITASRPTLVGHFRPLRQLSGCAASMRGTWPATAGSWCKKPNGGLGHGGLQMFAITHVFGSWHHLEAHRYM